MAELNPHVEHESSDIDVRRTVLVAIALALVTLIAIGLVTGLFVYFYRAANEADAALPMPKETALPPEPRIQRDPAQSLQQMHEEESRILNDYNWIDKKAGVARIPIDRAMQLVIERRLLTEKTVPATTTEQRATEAKPDSAAEQARD